MDFGNKGPVRRYQCFVCGRLYDNYEEYKSHILENHEEGREYIKCPACEAPVREIPLHFKVKHPNRIPPKNTQMRVSIWFDFKGGKRKARKPKFKEGFFQSEKMKAPMHYRSGYECQVYKLLEEDTDVTAYFVEPFKIPYCFEGKWYDYVPDLRVNYLDGRVQIMEIKPATQTGIEKNRAKWAAMNEYAQKMGWEFTVLTEVGIEKFKIKLKQQNS